MRKNLHLDHIDEAIFTNGVSGAKQALDFLFSLCENSKDVFVTTKWDGAPAIFAGTDPLDGKFFVATKSIFNKTPKLYKEASDITANEPPAKSIKLIEALKWLKQLNIPEDTILQGDLLWTSGDHKYRIFEGKKYITVHPNTLIYAWEDGTPMAQSVRNAELGIVFHTTYRGQGDIQNYQATFGANVSKLNKLREVWVQDSFLDIPMFSEKVTQEVYKYLNEASSVYDKANVTKIMESIPSSASGANIKTFFNTNIRLGVYPNRDSFDSYVEYVKQYYTQRVIESVKTESSKHSKKVQLRQLLEDMKNKEVSFNNAFFYTSLINEAKLRIVDAINTYSNQKVFVEMNGELKESNHEGYVVVNSYTGDGMKLIDRESFSHYNFNSNVSKGWSK